MLCAHNWPSLWHSSHLKRVHSISLAVHDAVDSQHPGDRVQPVEVETLTPQPVSHCTIDSIVRVISLYRSYVGVWWIILRHWEPVNGLCEVGSVVVDVSQPYCQPHWWRQRWITSVTTPDTDVNVWLVLPIKYLQATNRVVKLNQSFSWLQLAMTFNIKTCVYIKAYVLFNSFSWPKNFINSGRYHDNSVQKFMYYQNVLIKRQIPIII